MSSDAQWTKEVARVIARERYPADPSHGLCFGSLQSLWDELAVLEILREDRMPGILSVFALTDAGRIVVSVQLGQDETPTVNAHGPSQGHARCGRSLPASDWEESHPRVEGCSRGFADCVARIPANFGDDVQGWGALECETRMEKCMG